LSLDVTSISEAIEIHNTLFIRSHEILRSLIIERAAFETFSEWLILMAEDVLANEEPGFDHSSLLHKIDTAKVARYISEYFQQPILAKFIIDLQLDSSSLAMQVDGYDAYLVLVNQLMEKMKNYFRLSAEELREGVSWELPGWIDLQVDEEIVGSDAHLVSQVLSIHCDSDNM
jgi:hypothetical protein